MKKSDLFHTYINPNGKRINGTAAFNHFVFSEMGGIQNYNDAIGIEYIKNFVKAHSDMINEDFIVNRNRSKLKLVK